MSGYESEEAFRAFQRSTAFQTERAKMAPLVETVRPAFYRLIHERERA
jgi:heme-degrading monooxygenase HmoA